MPNPETTTLNPGLPRTLAPEDRVTIAATRPRQTDAPPTPFRDLLAGGVSVLMGGAQVATQVLGAPRLAAAIAGAESRASSFVSTPAGSLGSRVAIAAGGGVLGGATPAGAAAPGGSAASAAAALPTGGDGSDLATMQAMQRESQVFNMQLLELQEEVQQENRRFTTLSNVLRAKHDTAKAAVSNIRS